MTSDPYTMDRRLCDDDGMVSEQVCTEDNPFAPGLTYLGQINNLRSHGGYPPVDKSFVCTGHAHLACEHIRCTSSVHTRQPEVIWHPATLVGPLAISRLDTEPELRPPHRLVRSNATSDHCERCLLDWPCPAAILEGHDQ